MLIYIDMGTFFFLVFLEIRKETMTKGSPEALALSAIALKTKHRMKCLVACGWNDKI